MKKVLFIAPNYFDYYRLILNTLEKKGYEVKWVDDRPSNNLFEKCILRVKPSLLKKRVDTYFKNSIEKEMDNNHYDVVFVVMGQSFNSQQFLRLKKKNKNCKFILYLWDNTRNFPNLIDLASAFDVTYSFDRYDCNNYGYLFLPLFYSVSSFEKQDIIYDASFISTIKNGKLPLIRNIVSDLKK